MKKLIFLFIILFIPIGVYADSASSTVIMDIDSGRVLYSNNKDEKQLIASTTKIMTCIIALENLDLEKEITVGDEVLSMYGTNIYIEKGEKLKVKDLLYGLMLRSGNDAAMTLAINTSKTEKEFVKKMNEKAKNLGMNNTIFRNPHGLDDKTINYSTAYDMAILGRYAYKNKIYRQIVSTKKYETKSSLKSYVWYNRVSIINSYKYSLGGKNGYTPKAGKSLLSYAKKGNSKFMIVTLDDPDIYNNHVYLYNKYFKKYKTYLIIDKSSFLQNNNLVNKNLYLKKSFYYPLSEEEKESTVTFLELYKKPENSIYGKITIKINNNEVGKREVYQSKNKKKDISIFHKIKTYLLDNLKKLIEGLQKNLIPPFVPKPLEINKSELLMR